MASRTIGSLLVHLGFNAKEVDKGLKTLEKNLKATAKNMESAGRAMSIGFTAPFLLAARASIKAYDEEAKAVNKLKIALGGTSKALLDQAAAIQKTTIYADDAVIGVQAYAAALGHSETEISKMTTAAVGLAAGLGIGLDEAMKMLHKTTAGASGALGKMLPGIKDMTKEQLKSGAAVDLVAEKFAGYAEAMALTGSGPMTMLTNSVGDLSEQFGKALLPIVVSITDKIGVFVEGLKSMTDEDMKAAVGIGILVASIGPLLILLPKIITFVGILLSEVGLITAGVIALGLAFVYVWKNMQAFKDAASATWGGIKDFFDPHKQPTSSGSWGDEDEYKSHRTPDADFMSFGDFVKSVGTDIAGALGFDDGLFKLDEANAKIEEMASLLNLSGVNADGAGKKIKGAITLTEAIMKMRPVLASVGLKMNLAKLGNLERVYTGQSKEDGPDNLQDFDPNQRAKGFAVPDFGETSTFFDGQKLKTDELTASYTMLGNAVSDAVGEMIGAFAAGQNGFAAFGKAALGMAAQVVKAMLAVILAKATASAASGGPVGAVIGLSIAVGVVSAMEGMISKIKTPKLAQGGMAYGPTMAMVGDNPNAHIDPEVISPLSKLKGMMGNGGGFNQMQIVGVIRGDDILLQTSKAQGRAVRRGSGNVITF